MSEATQDRVEDLLEAVENGTQPAVSWQVKDWLHRNGIDEVVAGNVMRLCVLQSRFVDGVRQIAEEPGSLFRYLALKRPPEQDWRGALHYVELVDCSGEEKANLYAVFTPAVPRVGEYVTPERGQPMKVVGVEHVITSVGQDEGTLVRYLVPHVLLMPADENEGEHEG